MNIKRIVCGTILLLIMGLVSVQAEEATAQKGVALSQSAALIKEVTTLCDEVAKSSLGKSPNSWDSMRNKLRSDIQTLESMINMSTNSKNANGWKEYLLLAEVKTTIGETKPSVDVLENSLKAFESKENGLEKALFQPTRQSLKNCIGWIKDNVKSEQAQADDEKYFAKICKELPDLVNKLTQEQKSETAELITISLDEMKYYRPNTPSVSQLVDKISNYFSGPNLIITASSKLLPPSPMKSVTRDIKVEETIRGAAVQGNGKINGRVSASFVPNENKAEMRLVLDTDVTTQTIAYRDGASVYSNNSGKVQATKSIYVNQELESNKAQAKGDMDSTITGLNSGRGAMGTRIANQRVYEEKPYSQYESTRKMEQRIAEQFDKEVGDQLGKANSQLRERIIKPLQERKYYPRRVHSRSTDQRIYWSALVGNATQLGLPLEKSAKVEQLQKFDLTLNIHESCINNATFFSFAGKRVSDTEISLELSRLIPELNKNTKVEKNTEKVEESSPMWFTFAQDLPVITTFEGNKIKVTMKVDAFEKDQKNYPGLNIEIIYRIDKKNDYVLTKESVDVFPMDIKRGSVIPARYQAIRSMVSKRLEEQLKPEMLVASFDIPLKKTETQQDGMYQEGTFTPVEMTCVQGWFNIGFKFDPKK